MSLALAGLFMVSCNEDFTDWADPQSNSQEDAITLPGIQASAVEPIDLATVTSDSVAAFSLDTSAFPSGYSLENARIELTPQNVSGAKATTVQTTCAGMVDASILQNVVETIYGSSPVARTFDAHVYVNAVKDGMAMLIDCGIVPLTVTPAAYRFYFFGSINDWNADAARTAIMYPQSKTTFTYTTYVDGGNTYVKMWSEKGLGDWSSTYCTANNGDTSESGSIMLGDGGAISAPGSGYYTFTFDLSAMTYRWTAIDNQTPTEYANVSLIGGFNSWGSDLELTQVSKHNWYVRHTIDEDTQLKFRANHDWSTNWGFGNDNDWTVGSSTWAKVCTNGSGNIAVPAGTYDFYLNDITGEACIVSVQ